ncbi:MAG: SpoVA/SpoVAEb family sporulation membrane protein [Clostridia bacterium]|nr:SpoVA/SpoVAEb family sporulation membrane protein [Clostridia bacterium]
MKINKKAYQKTAAATARRSPVLKNSLFAYLFGGGICVCGQALYDLFSAVTPYRGADAYALVSIVLVLVAALLTGFGVFDDIAKIAGAGTLVPITGFANAVVSPAIDTRAEGLVLGVGAKIFTVAGPVLLYGILSGFVYGIFLLLR